VHYVESLGQIQRERPVSHIDFRVHFMGEIGCPDLVSHFDVAPAGAKGDFALDRQYEDYPSRPSNTSIRRPGQ
jgi:hypothetical protein